MTENEILDMAEMYADFSPDQSTKIGCVIAKDGVAIGVGYNRPMMSVSPDLPRSEKYHYYFHAEQVALMHALMRGHDPTGASLYLSQWLPCSECAKLICEAGIHEVVTKSPDVPERWQASIDATLNLFGHFNIGVRTA